jgi:hypothetical protein
MNLRQALTVVSVAELGTVSKTALRLRVAQPALSRQIIDWSKNSACDCSIWSDGGYS